MADPMPLEVAQYLRHLAVRCSRLSRDTSDPFVSGELETISVELVERAEAIEALLKVPPTDAANQNAAEIIVIDHNDVT